MICFAYDFQIEESLSEEVEFKELDWISYDKEMSASMLSKRYMGS